MKNQKTWLPLVAICMALMFSIFTGSVLASELVTITGTVNDDFQIITEDGEVFDIESSARGNDLINLIGSLVEVEGTVMEDDGLFFISVDSFIVLTEEE